METGTQQQWTLEELAGKITTIVALVENGKAEEEIAAALSCPPGQLSRYAASFAREIDAAQASGILGIDNLAASLHLSPEVLFAAAAHYRIPLQPVQSLPGKRRPPPRPVDLHAIRELAKTVPSTTAIATACHRSVDAVRADARRTCIPLTHHYTHREQLIAEMQQAIASGVRSPKEIAKAIGKSLTRVYELAADEKIPLPYAHPGKHLHGSTSLPCSETQDEIDALHARAATLNTLVDQAASSPEVARAFGFARQAAIYHLKQCNLYHQWKERRASLLQQSRSVKHDQLEGLVRLLTRHALHRAASEGWATETATRYVLNHPRCHLPNAYTQAHRLCLAYAAAQQAHAPLSLKALEIATGIFYVEAGKLLHAMGLRPMVRPNQHRVEDIPGLLRKIKKGIRLGLSSDDIAYFLSLPESNISYHYRKFPSSIKHPVFLANLGRQKLTYRCASQILEALAAGFSQTQTAELLDLHPSVVRRVAANRKSMRMKMVNRLRILYNDHVFAKPYPRCRRGGQSKRD